MFRPSLSCGQTDRPAHLLLVAFQRRDVVADKQIFGHCQFTFRGALKRSLGFGEAVGKEIARRKIDIRKSEIGIGCDRCLRCFKCSFKSACSVSG